MNVAAAPELDGKMIDAPIAARAQRLLNSAEAIAQRRKTP
jgi:citrate lyase beta subunit